MDLFEYLLEIFPNGGYFHAKNDSSIITSSVLFFIRPSGVELSLVVSSFNDEIEMPDNKMLKLRNLTISNVNNINIKYERTTHGYILLPKLRVYNCNVNVSRHSKENVELYECI